MLYSLRLTFKSLNNKTDLKTIFSQIKTQNHLKNDILFSGPYKTKQKKKIFTVLKSPHVNKKSREQFIFKNFIQKIEVNTLTIYEIFNFLIFIKNGLSKNQLIGVKLTKKC